ncbi:hypothetical protein F7D01_14320 [Erythrobacter sp. 3-20A1M]|uniref:hypothetical protein n=1 Tax=Erythrobacter sp. 3-20A1M TaxID=2653850 RepID=UPI001BFCC032|nr:hypothetical protein [Erythrobacter sp. 3-20A1M]QWC58084.1 hypothetical protein F7D01_14320 [Erythrobacter sp. 3-20A1M]
MDDSNSLASNQQEALRDALREERRASEWAAQALPRLIAGGDQLLGQDIVARVEGMVASLADQLANALRTEDRQEFAAQIRGELAFDTELVAFLHALAMEFRATARLSRDAGLDRVAPPELRALSSGNSPTPSRLASSAIGAQARYLGDMIAMRLPLPELPAEMFDRLVSRLDVCDAAGPLRAGYEEGETRLTLLSRLATSGPAFDRPAMDCRRSGLALFLTRLADGSGLDRTSISLALGSPSFTRLALAMRASGMDIADIGCQCALLAPYASLPAALEDVEPEEAKTIIAGVDHR